MYHNFPWYCWKASKNNMVPFFLIPQPKKKHGRGPRRLTFQPRPRASILLADAIIPNPAFNIGPLVIYS